MKKKNFALIGAAGYIAPRHMSAIADLGHMLTTAFDPHDCVGILDKYFPKTSFFTEFERFDRHVDKLHREGAAVDYVSVCSPNYMHDAHIRFGLRNSADVICEKPTVLNPWNLDALESIEKESSNKIFNILQLRHHPAIVELKKNIDEGDADRIYDIDLTYMTARGNWYYASWKGDIQKSGGIVTNIGIHFFDMLIWVFGAVKDNIVHVHTHDRAAGILRLEKANVRWFLSINGELVFEETNKSVYRSLEINGSSFDFSTGFEGLHTTSYEHILKGNGFSLDDCRSSIELVYNIRNARLSALKEDYHPLAKKPLAPHPFDKK